MTPPALLGRYSPPSVRVGQQVYCEYQRTRCRVSSWTDTPIPWPRVQPLRQHGGHGLLVTAALIQAIQTESAAAMMHHFGVGSTTVWNWRREFLPVRAKFGTPGSEKAHRRASKAGAQAAKAKEWTDAECDARAERAKAAHQGRHLAGKRWAETGWKMWEVKLFAAGLDDAEIAERTVRSVNAVRAKRQRSCAR